MPFFGLKTRYVPVWGLLVLAGLTVALGGSAAQSVDSSLAQARENLRVSEATRRQAAAELAELRSSGKASPEIVSAYEAYVQSVEAIVDENRKTVREMEAAAARRLTSGAERQPSASATRLPGPGPEPKIPEEALVDELAVLEQEFNDSLAAFDEMLLKEIDLIRAKSAEKMKALEDEAAAAARRLKEKGIDIDSEGDETAAATAAEGTATDRRQGAQEQTAGDSQAGTGDDREAAARVGSGRSTGQSGQPPQRSSSQDDDIVARQLREAAENETDPVLKAKLWKEYENYKNSTRD
ncbi:MAG: hypothetical protein JSW39_15890 [Desulfobacterales bacterium]|nr:MAG: hypothetical protein JSW39_15890 [Desulfobacterales bacterium]